MASKSTLKLAVLISGSGTTLQNLIDQIAAGRLMAEISVVIASRPGAGGIDRARAAGISTVLCDRKQFLTVDTFSERVFTACGDVDLICLAGWLSLLHIPTVWVGRMMNIHPALLPDFGGRGMYGRHVHRAVLDAGKTESGCTVHFVDQTYDTGPVILQRRCPVMPDDTVETLAARVAKEENEAYPQAIEIFRQSRLVGEGGTPTISDV